MFTWLGLLEASVVGGICIVLFFLISLLLGERYRAKYRKVVWLLIALRMCIPVSVSFFPKPIALQVPVYVLGEGGPAAGVGDVLPEDADFGKTETVPGDAGGDPAGRGAFTSRELLALLWGVGCAAVLSVYLAAHILFRRRMLKKSRPCRDEDIWKVIKETAGEMGLKRIPQVRLGKDMRTGAFTIGIFRSIIFLPDTDYRESDRRYIIRHETAHCAERDTQIKALFVLVNAVHWFNPLVWLMKTLMDQDMELACDERVLTRASREERSEYGEVLLSCIGTGKAAGSACATGYVQGVKFIKKRFRNIFRGEKKSGKAAVWIMALLLAAVSAGIGFEAGRTVYAQRGIVIDCGIELRTDVTGDGYPDRVMVYDNTQMLTTSVGLDSADGREAWFTYNEDLWASSYLVCGDLCGNGAADIVLMRTSSGMHLEGPVSVLHLTEEDGNFMWQEYPDRFLPNSSIEMMQPAAFDDMMCIDATIVEKDGGHWLRLIALDADYLAEYGDDDQVLCVDCSWQGTGWYIEDIQVVSGYLSENKREELLENNIYFLSGGNEG